MEGVELSPSNVVELRSRRTSGVNYVLPMLRMPPIKQDGEIRTGVASCSNCPLDPNTG